MMQRIRLMLVDDDTSYRHGLRLLLGTYPDFEVVGEAESGEEAVIVVETCQPDVVLMDLSMDGQGGIAATGAVLAARPTCTVMLLTGRKEADYVVRGLQAGARGFMYKKADENEIAEAIRALYDGQVYMHADAQRHVARTAQSCEAQLTDREIEILALTAAGIPTQAIAAQLNISERHTKRMLSDIYVKLGAHDRAHAVALAYQRGVIQA